MAHYTDVITRRKQQLCPISVRCTSSSWYCSPAANQMLASLELNQKQNLTLESVCSFGAFFISGQTKSLFFYHWLTVRRESFTLSALKVGEVKKHLEQTSKGIELLNISIVPQNQYYSRTILSSTTRAIVSALPFGLLKILFDNLLQGLARTRRYALCVVTGSERALSNINTNLRQMWHCLQMKLNF